MNPNDTPESERIIENINIAIRADTREQSLAHFEDAFREIENMELERNANQAMIDKLKIQLAAALNVIAMMEMEKQ